MSTKIYTESNFFHVLVQFERERQKKRKKKTKNSLDETKKQSLGYLSSQGYRPLDSWRHLILINY